MPEGDTLHRAANRLRPALVGQPVLAVELPTRGGQVPPPGTVVSSVEAVGKHLLITFENRQVLHSHLGMTGSWRLVPVGERWPKPRHLLRARVAVAGWDALCFSAPTVELRRVGQRDDPVAHLGPDLATVDADLDAAAGRFGTVADPDAPIGVTLLDQRVVAGIGNVYKSEVLHRCRVDPFLATAEVDIDVRHRLIAVAQRLLVANLGTVRRTTVGGAPGTLAVYRRGRLPCRTCATPIRMARQGVQQRSTYWCPTCQPPGAGRGVVP